MTSSHFGMLELGSNSLKFYRVVTDPSGSYEIETRKVPWRIAHDFYRHGELRPETVEHVLAALRRVAENAQDLDVSGILTLATGVFREVPEIEALAARIKKEVGVRLRVISGQDEAKLMAKGFRSTKPSAVLICDLGGSTTEWGWIEGGKPRAWGSLPLGAIRNLYLAGVPKESSTEFIEGSRRHCDDVLKSLPVSGRLDVLVTGGTAKTVARRKGRKFVRIEELREMIRDAAKNGAPEDLTPERREVFLPGLIILERILLRCEATVLHYSKNSVREGMAARLVNLIEKRGSQNLHSTLLLHTTIKG